MSGKKRLVSGAVFAVLALPAAAAAKTTSQTSFQEEVATLSFSVTTPLVCEGGSTAPLWTSAFISVTEHAAPGEVASTTARAELVRRNGCTGEFQQTYPVIPDANASVSGVTSAALAESFELFEYDSGEALGVLDVALDFTGSGGTTHRLERFQVCQDGLTDRTQSLIDDRQATVTGTVALNGALLFPDGEYNSVLSATRTRSSTTERKRCACSSSDFSKDEDAELPKLPANVTLTELQGDSAGTSFGYEEPVTCDDGSPGAITTSLGLNASKQTFTDRSGSSHSSDASAFLTRFDSCSGESVVGFAPISEPDYEQTGTTSATLAGTFELSDPGTGAFAGVFDANLLFTGSGPRSCGSSLSIQDSPAGVFGAGRVFSVTRSSTESRPATLSGTASLDGLELVDQVEYADLTTQQQTNLIIEH